MIIEPRIRSNICVTAHPIGCQAQVAAQINYVKQYNAIEGPRRVLVVGASNGYGLAARIASTFATGADTIGVAYERPGSAKRCATAGWYNAEAFKTLAREAGYGAWNINADAFSDATKHESATRIDTQLGQIDMLIYSIAAPRRIDPHSGELFSSVIKPIGRAFTSPTVDFINGKISTITAAPADDDEISATVKVMGGEDWLRWVTYLNDRGLLAGGFLTLAFSYIGPEFTRPIYREGTIGRAKADLEAKAARMRQLLAPLNGQAYVSINKALVTRSSAIIPAVPLYIALLYKVMKAKRLHEGCIQQISRLYHDFLFSDGAVPLDDKGRIRIDDWEMRKDVQAEVARLWQAVDAGNLEQLTDIKGMRDEFLRHHGFGMPGVDYSQDVAPDIF
jgi:enoyl-[acyl-carrier protein] reductase/trans-2-enoyl-CoA reductase (NAD+)